MSKLTSAFMKKHLTLFNKMVRAETYKGVAKMKYDQVKEAFNRDFREIESGKDGKTFYAPKTYQIDLDSDDKFTPILKELSKNLLQNKPKKASMTKEQLEAGAKKALSNTAAGKRMDAKKAAPEEDFNGINPNARKIQKEALKLLEDNKTFFEKIPVSKGYGKQKSINTNTNYYKEQKHNLINKTLYGSDNEATRRATFYLNKLTDRLKNKTAAAPKAEKAAPKPKPKKTVNKSVDEVKAMLQKVSTPKPVGKAKARLAAAAAAQAKAAPLSASGSARRVKKA
jgi:hypothetical protein